MFDPLSYVTTVPEGQSYKRAIRQLTTSKKEPAALLLESFCLGCALMEAAYAHLFPTTKTSSSSLGGSM